MARKRYIWALYCNFTCISRIEKTSGWLGVSETWASVAITWSTDPLTQHTSLALPGNLFQGMKGLKVLSLRGMSFPSLLQSIHVLQNLRTLLMEFCKLKDVSAIGALGKLKILSFVRFETKELPGEIGNL